MFKIWILLWIINHIIKIILSNFYYWNYFRSNINIDKTSQRDIFCSGESVVIKSVVFIDFPSSVKLIRPFVTDISTTIAYSRFSFFRTFFTRNDLQTEVNFFFLVTSNITEIIFRITLICLSEYTLARFEVFSEVSVA